MNILVAIITFALVIGVLLLISAPLRASSRRRADRVGACARRARSPQPLSDGYAQRDTDEEREAAAEGERDAQRETDAERAAEAEREQLEAAREAKYREIRDAELDYRTGKLSREDYEEIDNALRAEAIEILRRLDAASA